MDKKLGLSKSEVNKQWKGVFGKAKNKGNATWKKIFKGTGVKVTMSGKK